MKRCLLILLLLVLSACVPAAHVREINYEEIYQEFMESEHWKNIHVPSGIQDDAALNLTSFNIVSYQILDLSGNGIPQLWFRVRDAIKFSGRDGDNWSDQVDFFCTIIDGNVVPLLNAHNTNAQIGGSWIELLFDTTLETYIVVKKGFSSWGDSVYWSTTYDYADGKLIEVTRHVSNIESGETIPCIQTIESVQKQAVLLQLNYR